jgi:hypothetical protein
MFPNTKTPGDTELAAPDQNGRLPFVQYSKTTFLTYILHYMIEVELEVDGGWIAFGDRPLPHNEKKVRLAEWPPPVSH